MLIHDTTGEVVEQISTEPSYPLPNKKTKKATHPLSILDHVKQVCRQRNTTIGLGMAGSSN
jgi:hypothetical protein